MKSNRSKAASKKEERGYMKRKRSLTHLLTYKPNQMLEQQQQKIYYAK